MGKIFHALWFLATVCFSAFAVPTNDVSPASVEIARFAGNRLAAVSYTFDDGTLGHYTVAAPTLERYGFRGTFGVVVSKTADDPEAAQKLALKTEKGTNITRRVSWQEWRELAAKGHEIANHGLMHRGLPALSEDQLECEVNEAARIITQKTGSRPLTFLYPGNARNPQVREYVLKTHIATREHEERFGGVGFTVEKANGIIDRTIKNRQSIVIMTHAVAESGYQPITQKQLEEHLQYVSTLKDKLWVDTFANVSKYVRERDAAKVLVRTKEANQIIFDLTCPLDTKLFNAPLTCVISTAGQVASASARHESGVGELPVIVAGNKILVDAIPGPGAVTVQWTSISPKAADQPLIPPTLISYIGDSITDGAGLKKEDKATLAPPALCTEFLKQELHQPDIFTVNNGRGGATTYNFLSATGKLLPWVISSTRRALKEHPEAVQIVFSVMLGANDSASSGHLGNPTSPENYASNLTAIAGQLLVEFPQARFIFNQPIWYSPNTHTLNNSVYLQGGLDRLNRYFPALKTMVAANAQKHPAQFFMGDTDAYVYFEAHANTDLILEPGKDGNFRLHPNAAGRQALAQYWGRAMARIFTNTTSPSGTRHAAANGVHYDVFLLAGQSNMDGRAKAADLTGDLARYAEPLPSVLIKLSTGGLRRPLVLSKGFEMLQPGFTGTVSKESGTLPSGMFGPELSFGHAIAAALPKEHILLVKCAEGGTNLKTDWSPRQRQKLYERFIQFVRTSKTDIEANGDTFEIRGLLWHQGESDAGQPIGSYKNSLTNFIGSVRTDLGIPHLPVLIGQVYDNGKRDNIFADQKAVVTMMPETYLVESAGLETWDHGTHFDAKSQIELGNRFAKEMLKHLD